MSINDIPVTLVGQLTADPELRFTPSGAPVCNMRLAVNHEKYNRDTNQWESTGTSFYKVSVWRNLAENAAESLQRGQQVIVVGEQRVVEYDSKEGGKGRAVEITATHVGPSLAFGVTQFTKSQRGGGQRGGQQGGQPQGGQPQGGQQGGWGQSAPAQGGQQGGQSQGGWGQSAPAQGGPQQGSDNPWGAAPGQYDSPPF